MKTPRRQARYVFVGLLFANSSIRFRLLPLNLGSPTSAQDTYKKEIKITYIAQGTVLVTQQRNIDNL